MDAEVGGPFSAILGNRYARLLMIAGAVCIVDQLVKALIVWTIPEYRTVSVIPGFFNLTHIYNSGGAFGFLSGRHTELRRLFFLVSSFLALGLVFLIYAKTPPGRRLLELGLSLIAGGAVGNILDRIRLGKVIDFLDLYVMDYHWPSFNVADSAISIGIGLFIYHLLFKETD